MGSSVPEPDDYTSENTMHNFLSLTLEKLVKSTKNVELKRSCQTVLEELASSEGNLGADFNAYASSSRNNHSDKYFTPLRLACETENPTSQKVRSGLYTKTHRLWVSQRNNGC
ncbi:hypothetical protein GEMRC1_014158 [Eukaryota sp. GEM-RC1]